MNEYKRLHEQAMEMRERFPKGTRLELISMDDPFSPVPPGTVGTVVSVDDLAQIHMRWDNGSTLALCSDKDAFKRFYDTNLTDEQRTVDFGDETKIVLPKEPVDCTRLGFFDGLEEDCWNLVKQYCGALGVKILPNEDGEIPISFDIAKSVQDTVLGKLEEAGVEFYIDEMEMENVPSMNL